MFCARGKDHFQNCVRSQQQRLEREASSRKVKKAEGHSNVSAILKRPREALPGFGGAKRGG